MNHIKNIKAALARADRIDWEEGLLAYHRYNQVQAGLAMHYGFKPATGAAAFCELSPSNDYVGNLRSVATLMDGFRRKTHIDLLSVTTFTHCKLRAWKHLKADDHKGFLREHRKAPKITSFFWNIVNPDDPDHITIDGHMYSVWMGKRLRMREAVEARWKYEDAAHDFKQVAFSEFILPCQLQAVLWFTWKRIHKIIYKPQMCMLRPFDQWHLIRDPLEIKPYKERKWADDPDTYAGALEGRTAPSGSRARERQRQSTAPLFRAMQAAGFNEFE